MKIYKDKGNFSNSDIRCIENCCDENKRIFGDRRNLSACKDGNGFYLEYTDWHFEYGFVYPIKFRYCPSCGKKIKLIEG